MNPTQPSSKASALREIAAIVLMLTGVVWVYWQPLPPGTRRLEFDYGQLHKFRMQYARDALLGPHHTLPGWFSRELLGTPFWSNVQSFPFIPTRLLLLMLDPDWDYTWPVALVVGGGLAALFTYFYGRKIGLGPTASATAGWSFVCCGFFAARQCAAQLGLIESYCALPLMLWEVESLIQSQRGQRPIARWIVAFSLTCTCLILSGHPQFAIFGIGAGLFYAIWRGGWQRLILVGAAVALGLGCATFSLVPMFMLIGRSTRFESLSPVGNDIALSFRNLGLFFDPWLDGAPRELMREGLTPFQGSFAFFWDTVCYAGWMPWLAMIMLLLYAQIVTIEKWVKRLTIFFVILGAGSLLLALPILPGLASHLPGTVLRSPSRLLYFTEFSIALALAAAVQALLSGKLGRKNWWIAIVVIFLHVADLSSVDRDFVRVSRVIAPENVQGISQVLQDVGDGRVAIDDDLALPMNRRIDDVGFFDSIMLCGPYHMLFDLTRMPPGFNTQSADGGFEFAQRALQQAAVRYVITHAPRPDLKHLADFGTIHVYAVDHSSERAEFFPTGNVQFLYPAEIRARLRDPAFNPGNVLLLNSETPPPANISVDAQIQAAQVIYRRPDSDHIECSIRAPQTGFVKIVESWDPGWSATLDGTPVTTARAFNALLAVPVPAGSHELRLEYHTPGASAGRVISVISLMLLMLLAWRMRRNTPGIAASDRHDT